MTTLRERQLNALKQMLNLNQPLTKSVATEPTWKVLIYDRVGQDIISPLISIKELRELGVTLHVQLHSDRDPIPEVPAVYFCAPNEENLGRICQDLDNGVYDQYHLNFISPISRQKLEDLAASAIQSNSVMNIHKVFDQYLNFICLEDDLFIMKHQQSDPLSYYAINKGDTKDTEMEAIMDTIVESLFSVFVTLGNVPIIRSSKGNAAEMVAKKLDKKLRENLWDARNNLFHGNTGQAGSFSFTRPMLILLDRNIDMATPLHHTWTYQALAHDVLDLSLNRAVVPEATGTAIPGQKTKTRTCDLDSKDPLWSEHKGSPFPTVAEAIQEDLDKYRSSEAEVKKLKSSMGLDAESDLALSMVSDNTQRLTSAVNSLPQLLEKKRLIDMHTTIATAILNAIKMRRLDSFFELEEKIMSKTSTVESKVVLDLISDPSAGMAEDKMRLFIIYYLCTSQLPEEEYKKFEAALTAANCDIKPMTYMKRWKGFSKMSSQYEGGGTKTVSMFSKLVSQGSSFVMEGVKNLVVKKHKLPVSRCVEAALGGGEVGTELNWLDPRAARTDAAARARAGRAPPPTDAVVFVVGGGNYIEYHNLLDFAKQQATSGTSRKIIYGATTLPNASQFLKQLSLLGEELQSSEAEVKKLKSSMGLDAESDLALSMVSDNTQRLTSAVNSLPQLLEKKRLIDMHTTIATAILNAIKMRRLDSFFELEEKIMSKTSTVESKVVLDLISDPSAGMAEDKMRLFIIYYLCTSQLPEEEYKKFEAALTAANCDIKPMTYMKRWKGFSKMSSQYEGGGTKTVSMFSKLVSQGSSFVMEGVKNLVVKKHKLPVSRCVEAALGGGEVGTELNWLDPRAARTDAAARARAGRAPPPTDAVVFVVGGGNYIEYHNLLDFAKQQATSGTSRKIIYGATTLPNASQFLKQLSLLGEELQ